MLSVFWGLCAASADAQSFSPLARGARGAVQEMSALSGMQAAARGAVTRKAPALAAARTSARAAADKAESALRRAVLARGASLRYAPFNSFLTPQLRERYADERAALRLLNDGALLSQRDEYASFLFPQEEVFFWQWPELERALVRYEMMRELAYLRGLDGGAERGEYWRRFMETARVIFPNGEKRTVLQALRDPQCSARAEAWLAQSGYSRGDLEALTPVEETLFARHFAAWKEAALAQTGALDVLQARLERPYWHPSFSADRLRSLHDDLKRLTVMTDAHFVRWVDKNPYRVSYTALAAKVAWHWDEAVKSLDAYALEQHKRSF